MVLDLPARDVAACPVEPPVAAGLQVAWKLLAAIPTGKATKGAPPVFVSSLPLVQLPTLGVFFLIDSLSRLFFR